MLFPARLPLGDHYVTPREAEVLWHCSSGLTSLQLAETLFVSIKTIHRHKENIRERFGLEGYHALHQLGWSSRETLQKWVV